MRRFPDDGPAEKCFVDLCWPDGLRCPECGSVNVRTGGKQTTMRLRCGEKACGKKFSVKTGTVMESAKIG